ncbi:cadherin domain-containing protein [Halalkalibaculum sp. DA3122]|uniref:cadherin domain-containing protein n=1 Tax=Halalkalibaculum sp. DA3122 TaxID=3373607 RepID=UPI003753FDAC
MHGDPNDDGGNNIDANPKFVDAANPAGPDGEWFTDDDGLVLQPSSPAVDAGDNDAIPSGVTTDIAGNQRTRGGTVDIGAYESEPNEPPSFVSTPISASVDEHASPGTPVVNIDATDGDGGSADDNVSYSISNGNQDYNSDGTSAFAIDPQTGEITVDDAADLDYEGSTSVTLTIEATDDGGLSASEAVDITLHDVAETFVVDGDSQDSFDGKSEAGERTDGGRARCLRGDRAGPGGIQQPRYHPHRGAGDILGTDFCLRQAAASQCRTGNRPRCNAYGHQRGLYL